MMSTPVQRDRKSKPVHHLDSETEQKVREELEKEGEVIYDDCPAYRMLGRTFTLSSATIDEMCKKALSPGWKRRISWAFVQNSMKHSRCSLYDCFLNIYYTLMKQYEHTYVYSGQSESYIKRVSYCAHAAVSPKIIACKYSNLWIDFVTYM